jgi:hypothetical protein
VPKSFLHEEGPARRDGVREGEGGLRREGAAAASFPRASPTR